MERIYGMVYTMAFCGCLSLDVWNGEGHWRVWRRVGISPASSIESCGTCTWTPPRDGQSLQGSRGNFLLFPPPVVFQPSNGALDDAKAAQR